MDIGIGLNILMNKLFSIMFFYKYNKKNKKTLNFIKIFDYKMPILQRKKMFKKNMCKFLITNVFVFQKLLLIDYS